MGSNSQDSFKIKPLLHQYMIMWPSALNSEKVLAVFGLIVSLYFAYGYNKIRKNVINKVIDTEKPKQGIPGFKRKIADFDGMRNKSLSQGAIHSFLIAYTMANTNQIVGPQSNPDSLYGYILDMYGTKIWEQPLVGMMVMFSVLLFPLLLALAKKSWHDSYKEKMFTLPGILFLGWIGWLLVPY